MKKPSLKFGVAALLLVTLISMSSVWAMSGDAQTNKGSFRGVVQQVFAIFDGLKTLAKDVNLSDTQKQSIKAILLTAKPQAQEFHQQMKAKRHQLRAALLADNVDNAQVQSLTQDIASLSGQMATFRIQIATQVTQQLTPEQKHTAIKDLAEIDPLVDDLREEIQAMMMNRAIK